MAGFDDLWNWMEALKTSPLLPIALPILLATGFATLADWFDDYLATYRQTSAQWHADEPGAPARQRESREATASRSPALEAGSAHNAERY